MADRDEPPPARLREAVTRRVVADADVAAHPRDRSVVRRAVARALAAEGVVLAPAAWARTVRDLVDELAGLGPVEPLLRDPDVTDVMINGAREVWVERAGRLEPAGAAFRDDEHLLEVTRRVARTAGGRLDRAHPWVDAVLPDGVRLHAIVPPLADAPLVTLRRVPALVPTWDDLLATGTVTPEQVERLRGVVADRRNLVVCGRAGAGKTTLLARLLGEVRDDRVVVIEDAPELQRPAAHAVHLHVRPPTPDGLGGVDVATLLRNALRMRPDRIVVGEVRGAEVADLLMAMNTGHHGSATTVHANSADDARTRLVGMALLAGVPEAAAVAQVASAVDVVVEVGRDHDGRRRVVAVETR